MDTQRDLVLKLHQTPHKLVLAVTGGGAEIIGELLRYGQGSATLIEAVVPYDQKAFDLFVRGTPDKYCSPGAARDLAMAAFQRAKSVTQPPVLVPVTDSSAEIALPMPLVGMGISCSLAKDGERAGRQHHAFIAVQTLETTANYEIDFSATQRTRAEQEAYVALIGLYAIASAFGVARPATPADVKYTQDRAQHFVAQLTAGQIDCWPQPKEGSVVFPGAFHPFHEQHEKLAEAAFKLTGKPVDLEVCIHNVDKPSLSHTDLRERQKGIYDAITGKPWAGEVYFSALPTFMKKAQRFKNATFLVGWDTFHRIGDPKYADLIKVVETFRENNTKFLVFDRLVGGESLMKKFQSLVHPPLMEFAEIIAHELVPAVEMASSALRKTIAKK